MVFSVDRVDGVIRRVVVWAVENIDCLKYFAVTDEGLVE